MKNPIVGARDWTTTATRARESIIQKITDIAHSSLCASAALELLAWSLMTGTDKN